MIFALNSNPAFSRYCCGLITGMLLNKLQKVQGPVNFAMRYIFNHPLLFPTGTQHSGNP